MSDDPIAREKLLCARAEINEVLKRYDLGGFVVLHAAPTSAEVIMCLEPSYSVLKIEDDGRVRIQSRLEDYHGDLEAKQYDLAATANMLSSLFELAAHGSMNLGQLSTVIDREAGTKHTSIQRVKPH